MYKRYQDYNILVRWCIWLKYVPWAYLRGLWYYISNYYTCNREPLSFCLGVSIGDIQATKMHYVWSAQEVDEYLRNKKKGLH